MRRFDHLPDQSIQAIGAVDEPTPGNCAIEQFLIVSACYLGLPPERLSEFIRASA